ncbi:MAG TPA: winged helix-turn-helix domain-containing tetratricopeptide repeat protein [Pseudolabrys sp.]|nr:winged helix-turn-helix domain-containing tetratricopeptide repeat protein [Pseudolabrys sp.]
MQFVFAGCVLDGDKREFTRHSEPIAMEPQVFDLLLYLLQNCDRVVSRDDLITAVWNGRIVSESTLSTRITAARKAIGDTGEDQILIKTYPRKGIRFVGDLQTVGASRPNERGQVPGISTSSVQSTPTGPIEWGGRPSVAVLPFNNLSDEAEQDYFSDGVTEDIITALSKYRSLAVIARNSSFTFKGAGADARSVGLTLGADYLVDGSVRKTAERVRVTTQLVETETGRQLWAERYDRDLKELFELQDEITTAIAGRIEPEVGAAERLRAERKAVPELHAWDFFRLGTKHFYKSTPADNREAQRLLRRAIELDPTLAEAHGFLCYAIVVSMTYFDNEPSEGTLQEALAVGRKAVELDEQDAMLRFTYGRALLAAKAYGDAIAELEIAIDLNPYLAPVYCGLGDSLAYEGRFDEAIPYFQKAVELSPHDPLRWAFYTYRALAHIFARQFDQALEWARKATRVPNAHYWAFAHRVSALGHLRNQDDLPTAKDELLQRNPDFCCSFARRRLFYVRDGAQLDLYVQGLRLAGIRE